jgi:hypothetical protein
MGTTVEAAPEALAADAPRASGAARIWLLRR